MTKQEIINTLEEEYGVKDIPSKATKADLEKMLEEKVMVENTPVGEDCPVFGAYDGESPDCKDCPSLVACKDATEAKAVEKAVKKPAKKKESGPRTGRAKSIKSRYKDFEELVTDINGIEPGSMTVAWDKLLVKGAKMEEFVEIGQNRAEEFNVSPREEKDVRIHFKGRNSRNGWLIDETADGLWQVVGVDTEIIVPRKDTKQYQEWLAAQPKVEEAPAETVVAEEEAVAETEVEEKEELQEAA